MNESFNLCPSTMWVVIRHIKERVYVSARTRQEAMFLADKKHPIRIIKENCVLIKHGSKKQYAKGAKDEKQG